jgi:hypothetical protein
LILELLPVLAENAKVQMQQAGVSSNEQKQIFEEVTACIGYEGQK